MRIMTFAMTLKRMSALPKVLLLCDRLGGTVTYVSAADGRANIVLSTPAERAHRFAPQLRRIIDVVDLTELHMVGVSATPQTKAEGKRHTA